MTGASVEAVAGAISRRIAVQWGKYFPNGFPEGCRIEDLSAAIDEVAEFHKGCDELGSSDISIMVGEVMKKIGAQT